MQEVPEKPAPLCDKRHPEALTRKGFVIMENTQNTGNGDAHKGDAHKDPAEQPFFRVTIELRNSPGEGFENLQETLSQKVNAVLDFIRRGIDIRVETGAKDSKNKAERINIE
ncbi:MAG: hypothetical protein F4X83_12120 [Chloroflexi bacterium]|nr:hypothetical protein [Chloroflexota bacterium]